MSGLFLSFVMVCVWFEMDLGAAPSNQIYFVIHPMWLNRLSKQARLEKGGKLADIAIGRSELVEDYYRWHDNLEQTHSTIY